MSWTGNKLTGVNPAVLDEVKNTTWNVFNPSLAQNVVKAPSKSEEHASKTKPTFLSGCMAFIKTGPMNILLIFVPVAIALEEVHANEIAVFVFALLAICPLAERLGFVTEQIAMHTNHTIGGLLNVTFGNATELIVCVVALTKNLYRLIQLSLLGSILSNMLLVLGMAFWLGGLKNGTQKFKELTGQINSTVLMIGAMAIMFPSVMFTSGQTDHHGQLMFSRVVSLVMVIVYGCYIYVELNSDHVSLPDILPTAAEPAPLERQNTESLTAHYLKKTQSMKLQNIKEDEEEEEEDLLGLRGALFWLAIVTALIAVMSEVLVGSIEAASHKARINGVFVSTIVLPIIGNAAEHASAIVFNMKNKTDMAISIAIGSSTQITVFCLPLLVILSWIWNKPLDLNFQQYESFSVLLTVIIVTFAIQNGKSNWLVGVVLISAYFLISVGFYIHKDEEL